MIASGRTLSLPKVKPVGSRPNRAEAVELLGKLVCCLWNKHNPAPVRVPMPRTLNLVE